MNRFFAWLFEAPSRPSFVDQTIKMQRAQEYASQLYRTEFLAPLECGSASQAAATLSRHRRDGERARVLAKMAEMRRELGLPPVVLP